MSTAASTGRSTFAIVRAVPRTIADCLVREAPLERIDVAAAQRQHARYVEALGSLVDRVVALEEDAAHPDSCFVEDTAVVVGARAAICRMGAPERRGEEAAVRAALASLGVATFDVSPPGTIDGGDVLDAGGELWVGLSERTNAEGARQLGAIFEGVRVVTAHVRGALHLKSLLTRLGRRTLLAAAGAEADAALADLDRAGSLAGLSVVRVPDALAANVVCVGGAALVQAGFPESAPILAEHAAREGLRLVPIDTRELAKGDGALTCCSVLVEVAAPSR